ncbi:cfem protein [Fusarium langsethiae]|uniref:Cfem protein n=1 Tax=Fusarium langsethiae TaxID=179993 RepID=A0A0M9F5Q3_FUSLA|nr:cfem protein [Fusarium langsethiae]GKT98391.1 unnamed protein product [Fusarium langsethiae]GKU13122.1 unnamed protein product [Fusarium langsethiae]
MIVNASSPYSCHIGRGLYIKTKRGPHVHVDLGKPLYLAPISASTCLFSVSTLSKLPSSDATGLVSKDLIFSKAYRIVLLRVSICTATRISPIPDNRFDHYILLLAEVPAWTFVWLRLYLSWATYERLALDDYVMTVCGLIYTVFIPLVHFSYTAANSTIVSSTIPEPITDALKFVYLTEIAEIACSCLLRVSILLVCLRTTLSSHHMIATGTTIVFTLASSVVLVLLRVFRCSPIAFGWEAWVLDEKEKEVGGCLPQDSLAYAARAIDIFLNIIIFATMVSLISSRFPRGITSWLSHAFTVFLGAFALAVSGLRAQLVVDFFTKMQPVWEYHDRLIWMDIEVAVLFLWACSPVWQFFADSDPSDSEVQNQSTLLIASTDTPKKRGPNSKSTKTAIRSTGFLGMLTRSRTKKIFAPTLHLGDKTYGNVRTEIQGGQRFSMISQFTGLIGIQVKTRTVRRVEDNEWDTEKGGARENIKADDL